jgi:hypothetical protein
MTTLSFDSKIAFDIIYFYVERIDSGKAKWRSHNETIHFELLLILKRLSEVLLLDEALSIAYR